MALYETRRRRNVLAKSMAVGATIFGLAWLVLKPWQRAVIIIAGLGIAFLLIGGFPLLEDRLTPLGVLALIAALALVIVWVVRESRRFR